MDPEEAAMPTENGTGYLIVNARTAGGALPVVGATVTVYEILEDGGLQILAVMTTGANGATDKLAIETPPVGTSDRYGSKLPYSICNVDTSATGYYNVRNIGVQIFPGILSIQNVEMIPIFTGASPSDAYPGGGTGYEGDVLYYDRENRQDLGTGQ